MQKLDLLRTWYRYVIILPLAVDLLRTRYSVVFATFTPHSSSKSSSGSGEEAVCVSTPCRAIRMNANKVEGKTSACCEILELGVLAFVAAASCV